MGAKKPAINLERPTEKIESLRKVLREMGTLKEDDLPGADRVLQKVKKLDKIFRKVAVLLTTKDQKALEKNIKEATQRLTKQQKKEVEKDYKRKYGLDLPDYFKDLHHLPDKAFYWLGLLIENTKEAKNEFEKKELQAETQRLRAEVETLRKERLPIKPIQLDLPFDEIVKKANKIKTIPLSPTLYPFLSDIIPHSLRKEDLMEEERTATGRLLRYKRNPRKQLTVWFTFFVPHMEPKEGIPTYGELAQKAYIAPHLIALAEKTTNPAFRISDFLKVSNEQISKANYKAITNIYRTFAYGSVEIIEEFDNRKPRRTVGHYFDKVIIDEEKKIICTPFNRDTEALYNDYFQGKAKNFIPYPAKALTYKLDRYDRNFDNWAIQVGGLSKRGIYPLTARTLLRKVYKLPESKIKKQGKRWAWKWLLERLDRAKARETIADYKRDYGEHKADLEYILRWKIKVLLPSIEKPKPIKPKKEDMLPEEFILSDTKEEEVAEKITRWIIGFKKVRKSRTEIRGQLLKAIRNRGVATVQMVFDDLKTQSGIHPGMFWERLREV